MPMSWEAADPADVTEHLPAPAVQLQDLTGLDLLVDRYLGGAPVGVLEGKERRHPDSIGSLRREHEPPPFTGVRNSRVMRSARA
jgi:hypothetical protein